MSEPLAQALAAPSAAVRRRDSLRTRLVLWSGLGMVGLTMLLALAFYLSVRAQMIAEAKAKAGELALQTVRGLEATLDSVQSIGRTLAASGGNVGSDPAHLRALLHASLIGDPDIAGAMLIVEPGKLDPGHAGFTWYVRREGNGLLERSVEDLGYDYRSKPWYVRTLAAKAPWWSEPYANAATAGEYFTTYNLPLRLRGGDARAPAIGMVSVDVPLARLRDLVDTLPDSPGLQPQLYSPDGVLVPPRGADPTRRSTLAQRILREGRDDLAPLAAAMTGRQALRFDDRPHRRMTIGLPVADSGWYLSLTVERGFVLQPLNRLALRLSLAGLCGALLSLWLVRRYAGRLARPIEDLTKSARRLSQGDFEQPLRHTGRKDEVGVLARTLEFGRISIQRQLREIEELGAARQKLESELSIARDIQQAMLPRNRLIDRDDSHLEACALLEPAKAVGGDFYNFIECGDGQLWFAIGDVAGKGVPAALFMARATTLMEVAARGASRPDQALAEASRRLAESNETCMFATVLCGRIDVRSGQCLLASAAHAAPALLHADGRRELLALRTGPVLGIEASADFPLWRGALPPGATLLCYTDGVTEAFNPHNEAYGSGRLLAVVDPDHDAQDQCQRLIAEVHGFARPAPQSDDITVLAIRLRHHADPLRTTVEAAHAAAPDHSA